MIVTFHLAVFCVYHIWDTYISRLFTNIDHETSSNGGNGNASPKNAIKSVTVQHTSHNKETNQNENSEEIQSDGGSKSETQLPNTRALGSDQLGLEDEENVPQVVKHIRIQENEEGKKFVYDVKPNFICLQEPDGKGMKFIPPVYIQRYMIIENILKEPKWKESIKKVVDFGCAELSFEVRCLKRLFGVHEILAVDKDQDLLDYNRKKVCPTPTDFLQCRPSPLTIKVLCGSVANTNETLLNTDAVIAIELIEHLFPDDLECLPFTVFGFIEPKIAIFTTPNADFNVLFPGFTGFRHDDHKFEWSREQFEDWCNNLVQRYTNYTVTFQGIGPGPTGTEHLGCCSQMATFIKGSDSQSIPENEVHVQDGPYDLVEECIYPYFVDTRTREEKIKDEANFFLNRCVSFRRMYIANNGIEDFESGEIPLNVVMERVKCFSIEKMRNILVHEKWEVRKNAAGNVVVILPDDDSNYSSSETSEDLPINDTLECERTIPYEEENWDSDEKVEPTDYLDCTNKYGLSQDCTFILEDSVLHSKNVIVSDNLGSVTQSKTPVCNTFMDSPPLQESLVNEASCTPSSSLNSSPKSVKQNTALDHSVYETPQSSSCVNKYIPINSLSIDYECNEHKYHSTLRSSVDLNNSSDIPFSRSVTSPFETSTYSTPCCFQVKKTQISKCLSLQQINSESPILQLEPQSTPNNSAIIREQKDKISKSLEGFINQESFENHEPCSNASKVVDSGYPESNSDHDMDLDLTPEQFDDIDSESDENIDGSLPSPLVPAPLLIDDVENGDVANNNRDSEGNNLIADMEEEPFEFEAQIIEELFHEVPNFEGPNFVSSQEFKKLNEEKESVDYQIYNQSLYQQPHQTLNNEALEAGKVILMNHTEFLTEPTSLRVNIPTDNGLIAVKSDSSSATIDSWGQVELKEKQTVSNKLENQSSSAGRERIVEAHNSLTTLLEGYSKFSNCSIVKPVYKESEYSEQEGEETNLSSRLPKSLLDIGGVANKNKEETKCRKLDEIQGYSSSLQHDNKSVISLSEYCSAESLNDKIDEEVFISDFPVWLLRIDLDDSGDLDHESSSVFSLLDYGSYEELSGSSYDVPVDSRGGGDPQGG